MAECRVGPVNRGGPTLSVLPERLHVMTTDVANNETLGLGAGSYAEVEPDEIRARLSRGEDVFLLDVREPSEIEEWAYPIGVNIPLGQLGGRLDELPRDTTIVVACAVGGRSAKAAGALCEAGWAAENLTGGAVAWVATEPAS